MLDNRAIEIASVDQDFNAYLEHHPDGKFRDFYVQMLETSIANHVPHPTLGANLKTTKDQDKIGQEVIGLLQEHGLQAQHVPRFQRVRAPDTSELEELVRLISKRVGRCLQRQGLLEQDAENSWMMGVNIENHSPRVSLLGEPSRPARLFPPRE